MSSYNLDPNNRAHLYKFYGNLIDDAIYKRVNFTGTREYFTVGDLKVLVLYCLSITPSTTDFEPSKSVVSWLSNILNGRVGTNGIVKIENIRDEIVEKYTAISSPSTGPITSIGPEYLVFLNKINTTLMVPYNQYVTAFDKLKLTPNDANKTATQTCYFAVCTGFEEVIKSSKLDYPFLFLQFFSLFVTGYLQFLREGIFNRKLFDKTDYRLPAFNTLIGQLSTSSKLYCEQLYLQGLTTIKGKTFTTQLDKFNFIQKYRSSMVVSVFDFVAIWKYFDTTLYPTGVSYEGCRYIFSETFGKEDFEYIQMTDGYAQYFNTINGNNFEFYQKELNNIFIGFKDLFLTMVETKFTTSNPLVFSTNSIGKPEFPNTGTYFKDMNTYGMSQSDSILVDHFYGTPTIIEMNGKGSVSRIENNEANTARITASYPGNKIGNVLVYVLAGSGEIKYVENLGFAFQTAECFDKNILVPKVVNIFNCQKTLGKGSQLSIVRDCYSIGSHGVTFKNGISATYQICAPPSLSTTDSLKYKLALTVKSDVDFIISVQVNTSTAIIGQFKGLAKTNEIQLVNMTNYIFTFTKSDPIENIIITNQSINNGSVILLNLHFIPIL